MPNHYSIKLESGSYNLSGTDLDFRIALALESAKLPKDLKYVAKDFIKDKWNEITDNLDNLSNIDVPHELLEYTNELIEIIQNVLNNFT
jgi:hypothetical protein